MGNEKSETPLARPLQKIVMHRYRCRNCNCGKYRKDKKVNPSDLRLTQIPNWEKIKKMAFRIASKFIYSIK